MNRLIILLSLFITHFYSLLISRLLTPSSIGLQEPQYLAVHNLFNVSLPIPINSMVNCERANCVSSIQRSLVRAPVGSFQMLSMQILSTMVFITKVRLRRVAFPLGRSPFPAHITVSHFIQILKFYKYMDMGGRT